ncbi:hypothetical protein GCM10009765_59270 [Fodinicola feengrottensis]|uniref:Uncharacterized protein n=2 Tax=Fodinicola feengrottensis TaxID=435914 RepID=A0ABN2ICA9_9ACTN
MFVPRQRIDDAYRIAHQRHVVLVALKKAGCETIDEAIQLISAPCPADAAEAERRFALIRMLSDQKGARL